MLKLAERFFEWAIKRAAVMMCEVATKRDEAQNENEPREAVQPVRVERARPRA
jgi:hypothetical protein